MDTAEAQKKVSELDEDAKSLGERLESAGGAGRSIGDGIVGGAGQGMNALKNMGGALASAESAASSLGNAGMAAGGKIKSSFDNAASASDSLGTSFAKNFTKAKESGKSFGDSIKTGIGGAFDSTKKKASGFVKDTVDGAKKIGNAFLHPVQTIKTKFSSAMKDASKDVGQVGQEAQKSKKDLDDMGKSGESAGDKMKTGLGGVLKVLAAVAAAAMVVTGITKFVTAAMDASQAAENISYSFDKTFGADAPDVEGWAGNFASAVHRSESEVKSFLTSNRQLYESLGITGEAANGLSKITASLAYDIGNKFGIEDAEALSQLQDAIGGNESALAAYGVRLDKTTLQQSALSMGLGSNLEALDEAALAQVRMNAILEQTEDIQGNASKSLGGLTGGVKAVKAVWTDFMEKAGAKLTPMFDKIFGVILDLWPKVEPALLKLVDILSAGFEQAAPVLGEFAEQLLPTLLNLVGELAPVLLEIGGALLPVLSQVLGTVSQAIQPLIPLISTLATTLLPPLAQIFGTLVEKLLPPLAQLFGAMTPIIDALSPVFEVVATVIGVVADAIGTLIGWISKAIGAIGEFAQKIKDSAIGQFIGGIGDFVGGIASSITGNAKGTDDFEGGWTHVNEAGPEMIQAKHSGGMAYLPKGSAVIPASKTDAILDGNDTVGKIINISNRLEVDPSRTVQTERKPLSSTSADIGESFPEKLGAKIVSFAEARDWFNKSTTPEEEKPKDPPQPPPDPHGGNKDGGSPDTPDTDDPSDSPPSGPVLRKVIELKITVSSPDGTVPPEVLEQFREVARQVCQEEKNEEMDYLAIQNGYAG